MSTAPLKKAPPRPTGKVAAKTRSLPPFADITIGRNILGMFLGIILSGALAAFVFGNERDTVMLAVSHNERGVTALQSMNTPNIGSDALINWSKLAVSEIFTYNFNDISTRILATQRYFTKPGWTSFLLALGSQNVLAQVQGQRQFTSTVPGANAVITSEGPEGKNYFYTVQLDIVTSVYTGAAATKSSHATLKVARISTRDSDSGYPFGIAQIIK